MMEQVITYWNFDAGAMLLLIAFTILYFLLSGFKWQPKAGLYFSGLLMMTLVLISPLHTLGMHYLFSAHMISHIIILLISGPVMLAGFPEHRPDWVNKALSAFSGFLSRYPWIAWLTGIGIMWFWHIPAVFNASFSVMNQFSILPFLQTLSLLLAGMIFSWPLIGPVKTCRINPLIGVIYLFTACMACSLLGLLITFAPVNLYHHYAMAGHQPLSDLIRNRWGISRASDQQAAGLIMWVPCCFIYLSASILLFLRWLKQEEWTNSGIKLQEGEG